MQKVAVYGTLKRGFGNHRLLEGLEPVSTSVVTATHWDGSGGFPMGKFIDYDESEPLQIAVEIYEVDESREARLDILEGVPHLYSKKYIKTKDGDGVLIYNINRNIVDADQALGDMDHHRMKECEDGSRSWVSLIE